MGCLKRRQTSLHIMPQTHQSKFSKYRKYVSLTAIDGAIDRKHKTIQQNFKKMMRTLLLKEVHHHENYMISFLNLAVSCQQICSMNYVPCMPSIENMISQKYINTIDHNEGAEPLQTYYSLIDPISSSLLKSQPQLSVHFACLIEKVFKLINYPLTKKQHENVVKGTWNILVKYWKDTGFKSQLYSDVHQKVQWGLLELVSFKFTANKKQRFQAEEKLRKTLEHLKQNQKVNEQQSQYFCTLQLIQQL